MKRFSFLVIFLGVIFGFSGISSAEKVVILYTGETHADLYPCHCPIEPFGGLSRRAAKIKELRKTYPGLLVVDSGGFFAGGKLDEYSVNETLDKQRTDVDLQALKMMGYDALAIGDEEFNFGQDFLEQEIKNSELPFVSCNIKVNGSLAYVVRDVAGVRVGIIGVTPMVSTPSQLSVSDPVQNVRAAVAKLKNEEKVAVVILLSHLGEAADMQLLQEVSDIDFVICGHSFFGQDKETPEGNSVLLRPMWQGRKIGKLEIELEKGRITGHKTDLIGLGKDVPDDQEVSGLLPRCFSNNDCLRTGFKGTCENPGTKQADCRFQEYSKIPFLVVQPGDCRTCNTAPFLRYLKANFPGLEVKNLDAGGETAVKLIKQFGINALPAYFMGREAEKEANFPDFKKFVILKDEFYWLKPTFAGVSYFIDRKEIKNQLDLFINLHQQETPAVLDLIGKFMSKNATRIKLQIHFIVVEDPEKGLMAYGGLPEIEEDRRALCVMKHLPAKSWDYLSCRAANIASSWWDGCLQGEEKSLAAVKSCAQGQEAEALLKENIGLAKELSVSYGPLFLLNNKEIFGVTEKTTVEELEKFVLDKK